MDTASTALTDSERAILRRSVIASIDLYLEADGVGKIVADKRKEIEAYVRYLLLEIERRMLANQTIDQIARELDM